ncbi:hypothetical protein [Aquimarina rubra]|uniref:3,4-dihydroxy-2-butanone-4-phosphate synthase n=1 Tax=Aquimarina rubra TaxID=1920033 RepID=A0ABW5LAL7_9FLAO
MKKKLSLDKIKIAKLNNIRAIRGGSIIIIEDDPGNTSILNAQSIVNRCTDSTKTTPIGTGSIDPNDI